MKFVVIRTSEHSSEELFIFPAGMAHAAMLQMLRKEFPQLELVSAGSFTNYVYENKGGHVFDQIGLSGESFTLNTRSRPEDLELFRRRSNGY